MKRTKSKNEIKKKISYLSNSKPAKHLIDKSKNNEILGVNTLEQLNELENLN